MLKGQNACVVAFVGVPVGQAGLHVEARNPSAAVVHLAPIGLRIEERHDLGTLSSRYLCSRMRFSTFVFSALLVLLPSYGREWVDSTGRYRIEAELVAVRGDKIVLEKTDGEILSIPIARLSDVDQQFLKDLSSPKPGKPNEMAERPPSKADSSKADSSKADTTGVSPGTPSSATQLAQQTESILRQACYRCHGEDGTSEGGFNFVANLEKLSKTFAKPGEDSLLLERIMADEDSVMPPVGEEPRLTDSEIGTIKAWVEAGSPTVAQRNAAVHYQRANC